MPGITFDNTRNSDMDKDLPIKSVDEISSTTPLKSDIDIKDVKLKLQTTSDLYHNILYSVVPSDFDLSNDVTPEIQGFDKRSVWMWDDYNALYKFDSSVWQKVAIWIPKDWLGKTVFKSVGGVYEINSILNNYVKSQTVAPRYVE